jgi:hypothetical protein
MTDNVHKTATGHFLPHLTVQPTNPSLSTTAIPVPQNSTRQTIRLKLHTHTHTRTRTQMTEKRMVAAMLSVSGSGTLSAPVCHIRETESQSQSHVTVTCHIPISQSKSQSHDTDNAVSHMTQSYSDVVVLMPHIQFAQQTLQRKNAAARPTGPE